MKFILTIYICSFIDFTCTTGLNVQLQFSTWKECVQAAHKESHILLEALPERMVGANRLATKYTCKQLLGV